MSTCRWNVGQITTDGLRWLPWCWCCYSINLLTWISWQLAQLRCSTTCSQATKFKHFSNRHWRKLFSRLVSIGSSTGGKIFVIIRLQTKVINLAVLAIVQKATAKECLLHHTTGPLLVHFILYKKTCVTWHPQLKTGELCWNQALLPHPLLTATSTHRLEIRW